MTTWRMGRQNAARWRRTVDFVGGWMVERTRTNDAAAGLMARHGGGRADRSTWQGQEKKTQNYSSRGRLRLCGLPSFPDTDKTHTPHLLTEHERDQAEDGAEAEAQEPPGPPAGMERKKDIIKLGRSILSGCLEGRRVFNVHYSLGEGRGPAEERLHALL